MSQSRSIEERYWNLQKKAQEGKLKVAEMRREDLDKFTAYVWSRLKPMPSDVILKKHRALALKREFERRGFKVGAELCQGRVDELDDPIHSGFAAVPSVMVDEEHGAYEVLMRSLGISAGSGLDDYPTTSEGATNDGAKE